MTDLKNKKKLKGCMFLNRSYVKWQHALVLDLKKRYGIEEWCAYGYGKGAYEINKIQNDIKYEPVLIDELLFVKAHKEVVDEEYLSKKEKEYGHPYWWQEFTSERQMSVNWPRQFYNTFNPTLNHHEIKQQFQIRIREIEKMLDEVKPDFVFLADAGAMGINILYYIAKKKGIPTVILSISRFSGLSGFTDNLFGTFNMVEKIFEDIRSKKYLSPKREKAIRFIQDFRSRPKKPYYILSEFWNKSMQSSAKKFILFCKNFIRKCIDFFDNSFPKVYGYSPLDFVRHNFLFWLNSHRIPKFDTLDYKEDYVFFALTSEPEATLLMQAPYFADQVWVAKMVAQSLPLNFKLYVKDHPQMPGYRDSNFYKEIKKFPNIKLIDTKTDSMELIKNSKLVVTITGTVGFEALFFKKPVITFGSVNYNAISFIKKCRTPDDLPFIIKDALENHKHNEEEFVDFVSAFLEDSFKIDITKLIFERNIEKIKQNPDIKIIADNLIKYIKNHF